MVKVETECGVRIMMQLNEPLK